MRTIIALFFVAGIATASTAQPDTAPASSPPNSGTVAEPTPGVPVYPNDIIDRPYTVVGEVTAKVRKATLFSNEASQDKIYRELWERARKLGADAVVKAKYGDSHVTALSWGSTTATGTAIKFTAPAAANSNAN